MKYWDVLVPREAGCRMPEAACMLDGAYGDSAHASALLERDA